MPKSKSQPKGQSQSKRYTPPVEKSQKTSPLWVPVVMFTLLITGTLVIMVNYLGLLPGEQQNRYLLIGLIQITAGFIFATIYR